MVGEAGDRRWFRDETDRSLGLLFALIAEALSRATAALLDEDSHLAQQVIDGDGAIDQRAAQVTTFLKGELATASHDQEELETLVELLQIVPELERSADLAEHIARRTLAGLGGVMTPKSRGLVQSMSDLAIRMWQVLADAYEDRSRDASYRLQELDRQLDRLARDLTAHGSTGSDAGVAADLALIARFYERLGDHAVNIAQRLDAMVLPRRLSTSRFFSAFGPEHDRGRPEPAAHRGLRARLRRLRVVPNDRRFAEVFEEAAVNARHCADELHQLVTNYGDLTQRCDRIQTLEHRGDQLSLEVLRLLDTSFITPYDREDIHKLTEELDDVVDHVSAAASIMGLAEVAKPLPGLSDQTAILVNMTEELVSLIGTLRTKEGSRQHLERIGQLEREGDAAFRRGIGQLFSGDFDALDVIMWKDIVQAVEDSLNAVEDVADVVESILVKAS